MTTTTTALGTTTKATEPSTINSRVRVIPTRVCTRIAAAAYSRLGTRTSTSTSTTRLSSISGASASIDNNNDVNINNASSNGLFGRGLRRLFKTKQKGQEEIILQTATPKISPVEPFLHMLPETLHPYYRPLPRVVQVLNLVLATWMAFVSSSFSSSLSSTWKKHQFSSFASSFMMIRQLAMFLVKSVTGFLIAQTVLQETIFTSNRPSRVSMNTLLQRYFLPSTLSKYQTITIDPLPTKTTNAAISTSMDDEEPFSLGVHYLQYNNNNKEDEEDADTDTDSGTTATNHQYSFDAIYFQHGFGASSLSWLPVLPSLTKRLGARVALAHDTVGFGFTDRPSPSSPKEDSNSNNKWWYTSKQSSRIAHQILKQNQQQETTDANANTSSSTAATNDATTATTTSRPVCLVGHSMGSLSILRLATQLPRDTPKLIILSSPALGLLNRRKPTPTSTSMSKSKSKSKSSIKMKMKSMMTKSMSKLVLFSSSPIATSIKRRFVLPVTKYILSRAVGTKNSWRTGLRSAWGDWSDNNNVDVANSNNSYSDAVLRYSWPSIGLGWEDGILNFAAAQQLPQEDELDNDATLIQHVLELPNTKVLIVLGSRDKIVPTKLVTGFMEKVLRLNNNVNNNSNNLVVVPIVEMEGLGHCAFEEDTEAFCETVEQFVTDHWDTTKYNTC